MFDPPPTTVYRSSPESNLADPGFDNAPTSLADSKMPTGAARHAVAVTRIIAAWNSFMVECSETPSNRY
jgi:hypothetical protein